MSQTEYAVTKDVSRRHGTDDKTSFFDGQVIFKAHFGGLTREITLERLFGEVQELAHSSGELLAFTEMDAEGGVWRFRAEYYKISDAKHVVETITKAKAKEIGVSRP